MELEWTGPHNILPNRHPYGSPIGLPNVPPNQIKNQKTPVQEYFLNFRKISEIKKITKKNK